MLAVPPPAVRPSIKMDGQQRSEDDISHILVNIIKMNKTLQEKINDINQKKLENECEHSWQRDHTYYGEHSQYICSTCGIYK